MPDSLTPDQAKKAEAIMADLAEHRHRLTDLAADLAGQASRLTTATSLPTVEAVEAMLDKLKEHRLRLGTITADIKEERSLVNTLEDHLKRLLPIDGQLNRLFH